VNGAILRPPHGLEPRKLVDLVGGRHSVELVRDLDLEQVVDVLRPMP
jgi:hypothetical protein